MKFDPMENSGLAKNVCLFSSIRWLQQYLAVFNFIQNNFVRIVRVQKFVRVYCDICHISVHLKKNLSKLVNFCVATLILKAEENGQYFRHIILYYFKKGMMQLKCKRKNSCVVYGEGAMIGCMCQKWFAKFHAGDFLVNDALWSGRPVEVDSDQIETLIENNQCYTMRETANILKISNIWYAHMV